jgi:alkylation response protein AidB-like acyl-CoA dehydrogenase
VDLQPTQQQRLLKDSVADYLARNYHFAARGAVLANGGMSASTWQQFADLGLFAAGLSEEVGGLGGGPVETMLISEELGKALVLEPFLESAVLGAALLVRAGALGRELLSRVASGSACLAPALYEEGARYDLTPRCTRAIRNGNEWKIHGNKIMVTGAPFATHFLVSARTEAQAGNGTDVSLFVVPADARGLKRNDFRLIDGHGASDIQLDHVAVRSDAVVGFEGDAFERIEHGVDVAIAALCAEALGVMRAMLAATLDYARQRHQFGKPIGTFQVLQHRMVEMYTRIERAQSLVLMATLALESPAVARRRSLSAAKAFISKSVRFVAQSAIQIHGGIGITDELPVSHYFRRATVIESQFGSASYHLRRMSEANEE